MDDISKLISLYLVCSVTVLVASAAVLLATRRSSRRGDDQGPSYRMRLLRVAAWTVAAWTVTIASSLVIVIGLAIPIVAFLDHAHNLKDELVPWAIIASIGAFVLGLVVLSIVGRRSSLGVQFVRAAAWVLTFAGGLVIVVGLVGAFLAFFGNDRNAEDAAVALAMFGSVAAFLLAPEY